MQSEFLMRVKMRVKNSASNHCKLHWIWIIHLVSENLTRQENGHANSRKFSPAAFKCAISARATGGWATISIRAT